MDSGFLVHTACSVVRSVRAREFQGGCAETTQQSRRGAAPQLHAAAAAATANESACLTAGDSAVVTALIVPFPAMHTLWTKHPPSGTRRSMTDNCANGVGASGRREVTEDHGLLHS